jgi:hypothetical protein
VPPINPRLTLEEEFEEASAGPTGVPKVASVNTVSVLNLPQA